MSKSVFLLAFFVLSGLTISIQAEETVEENCTTAMETLRSSFYCDDFLISQFFAEIDSIKRLRKYIKYRMEDIDKEIKESCKNSYGFLQEQSLQCNKKIVHLSCRYAMTRGSGVYQIRAKNNQPFFVYCLEDPDGGDPWTLIQRRVKESNTFNRKYLDYVNGFGDMLNSFWMGLDKISELTNREPHELWVDLMDLPGNRSYAKYDYFAISDVNRKYCISALGNYTGTAGDSLRDHEGYGFSVFDKISDGGKDCAKDTQSGWWFRDCGKCNLNGEYYPTEVVGKFKGIIWSTWKGDKYSLQYAHMAIREKYSEYC